MNLEDYIENVEYFHIGKKTTVCLLTLNNGFEITSTSACLNEMVYKEDVEKQSIVDKALVFNTLATEQGTMKEEKEEVVKED